MKIQISNGKPLVTGAKVSTTKPAASNGTASATIVFNAPGSSAATVSVAAGKGNTSQIDIDLLSSSSGVASATFESLKPATKFTYQITARNANGQSKTVTGKFTTPAAPKKVSGGGGSSSGSSGGGSKGSCIGWNLEAVQDYLGYDPKAYDCSGSRSILWSSNWWVIGYSGSALVVSKSPGYCS